MKSSLLMFLLLIVSSSAFAEFRSAKDMQKECRVALDVLHDRAEKNFQNTLFAGECIGYVQAAADAALAFSENVGWYKLCLPDKVSTETLIQKFIVFADRYPEYELASTAMSVMLRDEYPCTTKRNEGKKGQK